MVVSTVGGARGGRYPGNDRQRWNHGGTSWLMDLGDIAGLEA